jgi:ubiquinone/menaquinone biosynthesis C-methylase UbiE
MTRMSDPSIWDRYWQFDRVASCFDAAGTEDYDDSVAGGWRRFFEALPPEARILDLCCGNGAVALIAAETGLARGKAFEIVAVDQAAIDPRAYVTRHREAIDAIDFRSGTAAETLPFDDDRFDAAVSQYGIEYSDMDRSIAELGRVIAPGGRVRLVLHAAEGVVSRDSRGVIAEADFLLDTVDLPGAARRCYLAVSAAERTPDASEAAHREARASLADFETALGATAQRVPGAMDRTMLRNAGSVLLDTFNRRARFDVEQLVDKANDLEAEIAAHRGRLQALVDSAVDKNGLTTIRRDLSIAGATDARHHELRKGGDLIGHVVEAEFPAQP